MIGQEVESFSRQFVDHQLTGQRILRELEDLIIGERVKGVNFQLKSGQILGLTGLLGAGQNELVRALYGIQEGVSHCKVRRDGKAVTISSPEQAIDLGLCLLTENRKEEGLFLDMSVKENISMPSLSRFLRSQLLPLLTNLREKRAVQGIVEKMNVVTRSAEAEMRPLNGGQPDK